MGCIGKDRFGEILEERTRAAGVNVTYQYNEGTPTGTCAVLITGKQRSAPSTVSGRLPSRRRRRITQLKIKNRKLPLLQAFAGGFFLTVFRFSEHRRFGYGLRRLRTLNSDISGFVLVSTLINRWRHENWLEPYFRFSYNVNIGRAVSRHGTPNNSIFFFFFLK